MSTLRERWRALPRPVRLSAKILGWIVGLRVLLALLVLPVASLVARSYGFTIDWHSLALTLRSGQIDLRGLELRPRVESGDPAASWLTLERLHADLALRDLFSGELRLQRLELDGLEVLAERRADGSIPWLEHLRPAQSAPAKSEPAGPIDLRAPVRIDHLRMSQLALHLADAAAGCDVRVIGGLRGENLGYAEREGTLQVQLTGPGLFDHADLALKARTGAQSAEAQIALSLQGLDPAPLAGYLAPLGLAPDAHAIDGRARLTLELSPSTEGPQALAAKLELRELSLARDGEEALGLDKLALSAGALGPSLAREVEVELEGLRVLARRNEAAAACFGGLKLIPVPSAEAAEAAPAPRWSLKGFTLKGAQIGLRDETFVEPQTLRCTLPVAWIGALDPELGEQATEVDVKLLLDPKSAFGGLHATLSRVAHGGTLDLRGELPEGALVAMRPYLLQVGIEPAEPKTDGFLDLELKYAAADDGSLGGSAHVSMAELGDLMLGSATLTGLRFDPRAGTLAIADLETQQLHGKIGRLADGRFFAGPLVQSREAPAALHPRTAAAPAAAGSGLTIELGALRCYKNSLQVVDACAQPKLDGQVDDFGLLLGPLRIGGIGPLPAGKVHAWMHAPRLLGNLELQGELRPEGDGLAAELAFDAAQLERRLPEIALAALGIETEWQYPHAAGKLDLQVAAGKASAHLRDLVFEDEHGAKAALKELSVEGLALDDPLRKLGTIRLKGAECALARDEQGALHAFGLRLPPPAAGEPEPFSARFPVLPELGWTGIEVEDARVHWTDAAQGRKVDSTLSSRLHCGPLNAAQPMPFTLALHADSLFESLDVEGQATLAPNRIAVEGALEAQGFAPTLAGYLPPGVELRSSADKLTCKFHALVEPRGELALHAELGVDALRWGDAQVPERLAFESARLDLARVSSQEIELAELSLRGLRCDALRQVDQSVVLGPLRQVTAPPAPPPEPLQASPLAPPPALPRFLLDKLELELARLTFRDETRGSEAKPLVLSGRFATEKPFVLVDAAPETLPPLEFLLRGSAEPLAGNAELRVSLEHWLEQPELDLHLLVGGLRGSALTEMVPELASRIDGSGLEQGELEARLKGRFAFARRGVGRFDFARPFAAELSLEQCELRSGPGGEKLAGVERVQADFDRIDPRTGNVRAKAIEITKPFLRAERTSEGLRCCGLLLRTSPAGAAASAERGPRTQGEAALAQPLPELGCARLSVNGLDVLFTDRMTDPPVLLPLTDLDLELRGLTTRALREPLALAFSGSLRAGNVTLAPHGSVREPTQRALFGTCELGGRVQLYPEPAGWFRLGLDELQLVNFRAQAAEQGVLLEDGRMDLALRGRLSGARGLSLESVTVLSEIELSETENGPIQSALGLGLPTQAALALVRDLEGNLRLPARVNLGWGSISKSEIVQAALASVSAIVARAILSSPFRVVAGLAGSAGVGATAARAAPEEHVLEFDEGSVLQDGLPEGERLQLAGKLSADDRVRIVLEHGFSAGDLARARVLANPDPGQCRELSQRLRQKKAELSRARAEGAARVRVELAVGRNAEARAGCERLRAIDAELGASEEALDRVHELLRQGADRHAEARLRAAARALAGQRLQLVLAQLLAVGIDPARIELKPPRIEAGDSEHGSVRLRLVRKD